MGCKSICLKYKAVKVSHSKRYENGQVRCKTCDVFMNYTGIYCPCCGIRVRTRPRSSKFKMILPKPVDTIPVKCLNESCQNNLSPYDLKKLDVKFSWQRFCIKCRINKKRIKYINCQQCNVKMSFVVGNHNLCKIYCPICAKIRHRKLKMVQST